MAPRVRQPGRRGPRVTTVAGRKAVVAAANGLAGLDPRTGADLSRRDTEPGASTFLGFAERGDGSTDLLTAGGAGRVTQRYTGADGSSGVLETDGVRFSAFPLPAGGRRWQATFPGSPSQVTAADSGRGSPPDLVIADGMVLTVVDGARVSSAGSGSGSRATMSPSYSARRAAAATFTWPGWRWGPCTSKRSPARRGAPLWSATVPHPVPVLQPDPFGPLSWWEPGSDGWPQLVVSCARTIPAHPAWPPALACFPPRPAVWRARRRPPRAGAADFDGDGLPDLYWFQPAKSPTLGEGGLIHTLRGGPPEVWRRPDSLVPAGDLDGDGVTDLLSVASTATVPTSRAKAYSGRDGRLLWQTDAVTNYLFPLPMPHGDLDGDGVPDFLSRSYSKKDKHWRIGAVSGKTGRPLWTSPESGDFVPLLVTPCELGGGRRGVLVGMGMLGNGQSGLVFLSGGDGKAIWKQVWDEATTGSEKFRVESLIDLDGDGVPDVLVFGVRGGCAAGKPSAGPMGNRCGSGRCPSRHHAGGG